MPPSRGDPECREMSYQTTVSRRSGSRRRSHGLGDGLPAGGVAVGARILSRLDVGVHVGAREDGADGFLDVLEQVMTGSHRPVPRHQHVHRHEALPAGFPGLDGVEFDLATRMLRGDAGEHLDHLSLLSVRKRMVHQALHRMADQPVAGPEDVQRHADSDQGVQREPARQGNESDADDDPHRRPHIGEEVLAICHERDRSMPPPCPQDEETDDPVDRGGHQRDGQPDPQRLQRLGIDQSLHGRHDDEGGGHEDHHALGPRREVLGLPVAEVVAVVGGAGRDGQGDQGEDRGSEIDDRLERVRQEPDGPGEQIGGRLQADGHDGGGDGEPGPLREIGGGSHHDRMPPRRPWSRADRR